MEVIDKHIAGLNTDIENTLKIIKDIIDGNGDLLERVEQVKSLNNLILFYKSQILALKMAKTDCAASLKKVEQEAAFAVAWIEDEYWGDGIEFYNSLKEAEALFNIKLRERQAVKILLDITDYIGVQDVKQR